MGDPTTGSQKPPTCQGSLTGARGIRSSDLSTSTAFSAAMLSAFFLLGPSASYTCRQKALLLGLEISQMGRWQAAQLSCSASGALLVGAFCLIHLQPGVFKFENTMQSGGFTMFIAVSASCLLGICLRYLQAKCVEDQDRGGGAHVTTEEEICCRFESCWPLACVCMYSFTAGAYFSSACRQVPASGSACSEEHIC